MTVTCCDCGTPGGAGKTFCAGCGALLSPTCPACGHPITTRQKFCAECGTALRATSSAPAPLIPAPPTSATLPPEEHRLVTALFCDLVGFTPLAEQLDTEEVRDIVAAYFATVSAQVERYGGTVDKYAGDAVLALFGIPVAHEDDAERAVLSALAMQHAMGQIAESVRQRHGVGVAIRVGINTGEVVSGSWDASGQQQAAVTGDAVNTAARLQTAADPGEVVVGAETMQLARRRVRFGERRDLVLKGKARPVPAYSALGVREQVGERWEGVTHRTPLIGREGELSAILAAWDRAQRRDGQLITLVGEPGVGKSRLLAETLDRIQNGAAGRAQILRGRCLSYGQSISLWLLAEMLRSLCAVREDDGPTLIGEKISSTVEAVLAGRGAEDRALARDVLGEVLGLSPGASLVANAGPQVRRQSLVRILGLFLGSLSAQKPLVLVLEDVHWLDAASQEILNDLLADVPRMRMLVLAAQRPEGSAPWSEWEWTVRLTLRPLGDDEAAVLTGAVLGGTSASAELLEHIRERAAGNPFFVEELLRYLVESNGLEERDGQIGLVPGRAEKLPSTLTEVLQARLDRLENHAKGVAQVGSVIGRSFGVRLLARVMEREEQTLEQPLRSLQQAEIAFPKRSPDPEYVFKHVTLRDVAYGMLMRKRQRQLHLAVARAIASLYPSDDYVEMIAYHYARTEEHGEAAAWLEQAGDRAADVYANEMAITHYEEARLRLERVEAGSTACARLDEKLGAVLTTVGQYDRALAVLERAAALYRGASDHESEARVLAQAGQVHYHRGSSAEGIAILRAYLAGAEGRGRQSVPSHSLASIYAALTLLFFATGRYEEQLATADQATTLARTAADQRLLARAEVNRALALLALSHREEAQQVLERAIPLAEAVGDLDSLARALDNLSNVHYFRGEFDQSRLYLERGLAVAEQMGDPAMIGQMLFMLGTNAFWVGSWSTSRAYFERDMAIVRTLGTARISALPLYGLGQLSLIEGDWETATRYLEEVVHLAEQSGNLPILKWAHRMLAERELREGDPGRVLARLAPLLQHPGLEQSATLLAPLAEAYTELGNEAEAEAAVAQAVARATADDDRIDLAYALRASLLLAIRQQRWDDALRTLDEALRLARAMNYPYGEGEYLYAYGAMCQGQGAIEEARQRFQDALTIFCRLGATKDIERTERTLAALA